MVLFALLFTLGVWYLQQQAALPNLPSPWLGLILPALLLLPRRVAWQRMVRTLLLIPCVFLFGYFYAATLAESRLADALPDEWQGRDIDISGIISELPRQQDNGLRFSFTVEQVLTPEAHVPAHILLSTYDDEKFPELDLHAGERWQLTVRLKQPHGSSNPHNFDFEAWALEHNVRAVGYVRGKGDNRLLDEISDSPAYYIERLRETVRTHFQKTLGDAPYTGILTALAVGDQNGISAEQWAVFNRTGVTHLMSISGLHITMLAGIAFGLAYSLWRRSIRLTLLIPARKVAALSGLFAALIYTLVSGYGIPAQRTLYMISTMSIMLLFSRNVAPSQLLASAVMVVLLLDPWAVISPGFWLSFGAVLLIFYISANRLRKQHHLIEYGRIQWAMTLGLIPLLLALFQQLSLVSPIANAFAIPLVSFLIVPITLLGTLPPLEWLLYLAHQALTLCMWALNWLNALPYAVWTQHAPPDWAILLGGLGVLWLLLPRGFPGRWLGVFLMVPLFTAQPELPAPGQAHITVFDVGQGLSVLVRTQNHALLYDAGPDFNGEANAGNRILLPALRGMGIAHLDTLVLSHDDRDHTGGAAPLLEQLAIDQVLSSLSPNHALLKPLTQAHPCLDGQTWTWDGIRFDMLHPDELPGQKPGIHDNDASCVLRISTGTHSVLLTGDIEEFAEYRLLNAHRELLPSTLLVAPHHGSKTSSSEDFVAATHPRYVVFTAGYHNRFGHPREEIEQRYRAIGSEVLRSDFDGAIAIRMDGNTFNVSRRRQEQARYWQLHQAQP